jgi:hypothetical protein
MEESMAWRLCCESGLAHRIGKLVYGRERLRNVKEHSKGADYAMTAHMNDDTFLIVCRGTLGITDNPNDWLNNLGNLLVPLGKGKAANALSSVVNRIKHRQSSLVHSGFYDSVENVSQSVMKELTHFKNQSRNGKVIITGHSKGGAMAQIFADRVAKNGFDSNQIEVITFGAPKVGNNIFADYIAKVAAIKNIINESDAIPTISVGNYKAVPPFLRISSKIVEEAKKEGFTQFGGQVAAHFMAYTFNYYPSKESRELLKKINPIGFEAVYGCFQ